MKEYHTMATNTQTMATGHSSAIELALHKIDTVDVPQGKHIALAYSGGLDSTLCVKLSQLKYYARKLTAITVDVGQGEAEIGESSQRAIPSPDANTIGLRNCMWEIA